MARKLNVWSSRVTQAKSQGASQAMLFGAGLRPEDLEKPQVGIASVWWEGNPCNMHLLELSALVKQGVAEAGLVPMRFNTIGVSDGISMGTAGMSYSLQSRDLIADSIETVMRAQWYDANVCLPGCDKNMPGALMAMGRVNRPSLMVFGGTIRPGHVEGRDVDLVSAMESYGALLAGKVDPAANEAVVRGACPGPGACGGMYTANTMASAADAMGMTLPFSASTPATDPGKGAECLAVGAAMRRLLE
jgi:dihydroxy-acid dehydratase